MIQKFSLKIIFIAFFINFTHSSIMTFEGAHEVVHEIPAEHARDHLDFKLKEEYEKFKHEEELERIRIEEEKERAKEQKIIESETSNHNENTSDGDTETKSESENEKDSKKDKTIAEQNKGGLSLDPGLSVNNYTGEDGGSQDSKTIFELLINYFAKPLVSDIQHVMASSLSSVLNMLILELLNVYNFTITTTAPLDIMKAKIELLGKDKSSFLQLTEISALEKNVQLILDMNQFLLTNQQYTMSPSMQKLIKKSSHLAQKSADIIIATKSDFDDDEKLHKTQKMYESIIEDMGNFTKENTTPHAMYSDYGFIAKLYDTWKLFELEPAYNHSLSKFYAASVTFTALLQTITSCTEFVIKNPNTEITIPSAWDPLDVKEPQTNLPLTNLIEAY